ncbi:MAG TPA: (Fe-S)-binding protein [Anaerolineales bacterium]|nr:(Fe-S)-binding protein [Anaerolineales bacterium]
MPETVQLMITCLADTFFPEVGVSMVKVLERIGLKVEFPEKQTCCGQPQFNAGLRSESRKMAEYTIRAFENTEGYIIIPSGSCATMIKHGYKELFASDPDMLKRAAHIGERITEFSQFLVDVMKVVDVGASWHGKVAYHPSCHLLRGLDVDQQPRLLLSRVKGIELVDLPHEQDCCGFGGIFSVVQPELSGEMLKRKIHNFEVTTAPTLVLGDTGCLMNIQGGIERQDKPQKVVHIAQILANRDITI